MDTRSTPVRAEADEAGPAPQPVDTSPPVHDDAPGEKTHETLLARNPQVRVKVIANPVAGKKVGITTNAAGPDDVMRALEAAGIHADLFLTQAPEDGTVLAMEARDEGYRLVVSCGGDGTTDDVAAGLIGTDLTLGIIPLGSANNVARMLHIPFDVASAVRLLQEGEMRCIDVGRIGGPRGRAFLETAGIGLDAELFPLLNQLDQGAYLTVFEVLRTFLRARPRRMTIRLDRRQIRVRALLVIVANGPYWGYSIPLAPDAKVNDHRFDVIIFQNFSKWEFLRHAVGAFLGRGRARDPATGHGLNRRVYHPKLRYYRARSVAVSSRRPLPVHGDARPVTHTPVTIQIQRNALNVIVGQGEHVTTGDD